MKQYKYVVNGRTYTKNRYRVYVLFLGSIHHALFETDDLSEVLVRGSELIMRYPKEDTMVCEEINMESGKYAKIASVRCQNSSEWSKHSSINRASSRA
tara:strand:+ start:193 stop:486 length:294 start_codon:yes stop_codon:yes gene_type:complete